MTGTLIRSNFGKVLKPMMMDFARAPVKKEGKSVQFDPTMLTFEVRRGKNKQFRWCLRSRNGKIIANSGESYHRKCDCMRAIGLIRAFAGVADEVVKC